MPMPIQAVVEHVQLLIKRGTVRNVIVKYVMQTFIMRYGLLTFLMLMVGCLNIVKPFMI